MSLTVSVIIPVHNAAELLEQCLVGIRSCRLPASEVLVVDDASTDHTAAVARSHGATVLELHRQSGPAAARNLAARHATGEILFFLDADVVVAPDVIERVRQVFVGQPDLAAAFGSYDDEPAARNFASRYTNLRHHFVHQASSCEASTFWSGCGAIRRDVFLAIGGFDTSSYQRPSIEDIELGYQLRRQGHRITLVKDMQCQHLKRWTLGSLLRTDIFHRAVPWSRLIVRSGNAAPDLNLRWPARLSAGLVWAAAVLGVLSGWVPWAGWAALVAVGGAIALNLDFLQFMRRKEGWLFAARALPMHLLYYMYSALAFGTCVLTHAVAGRRSRARVVTRKQLAGVPGRQETHRPGTSR